MRALIALAVLAAAAGARADTTEAQARIYVWSALMTGAAHSIVSPEVALTPTLRAKLALPADAERDRIYEALVGLTRGRLLRVRAATAEEAATLGEAREGQAFFVVEGGAAPLLLAYDLQRDQMPAIALLGEPEPAPPAPPPSRLEAPPVAQTSPSVSFLLKPVYFAHGEAALSEEALKRLDDAGLARIARDPGVHYVVRGHSDRVESARYKQQLSEERAAAVRDYLVGLGAAADDVRVIGFGSLVSMTACAQHDRAVLISCLGPDRRVTVEVVSTPR